MLAFISLALFLSTAYSQTRTIWEYQLGTFLPNPAPGTPLGDHGALTEGFNLAVIPPEDSDWIDCYPGDQYCKSPAQINTVAPQPSRLPQGSCWTTFVYEYFQTFVTVPDDVTISQFSVVYPGGVIDDATRISIFNSQYPNGYTLAYTWFGESNTIDLAAYLVVGVNRLVITQLDVCCCANTVFAILTLNGQPLNPTCVPPAQDPCTTSTWDPTVGDCVLGHVEEGATCEDGDLCTVDDKCIDGACVSGDPVVCEASDQCHLPGTCDSTTGICSNPPKCDGKRCDDGNACTQLDVCKGGICVGKKPIICTVESDCQEPGECQPETGLCPRPENKCDGTTCNDGSACTVSDTCLDGECTGTPSEDGTSCDDGNACTENDTCQSGVCVGQAITCTASDECHDAGVCDPSSGECSDPVQKEDGSSCNDHDACTKTDVCTNGKCAGVQVCCRTGHGRCGTCVDDCRGSHRSVLSLFKLWNRGGRASGADDVDRGSSGCSGGKVCCVPRDQSTCRNNNNSCSIPDEDD